MKQIEFSPKVVTICELTAIADFNLVIPRSDDLDFFRAKSILTIVHG